MLFSILIPVYNAEKYLRAAVLSVLDQSEDDFELILANDGSTDSSGVICGELRAEFPDKIRVIEHENIGAYATRQGLASEALGDYLLFVDADDMLKSDALAQIKAEIARKNADMILFDLEKVSDGGNELFTLPFDNGSFFEGDSLAEIYKLMLLTKYLNSMCTKAVRKSCFDLADTRDDYKRLKIGLDAYQSYSVIDRAGSVSYIKKVLYTYRKNAQSLTGALDYKKYYQSLGILMKRADQFIEKWHISDDDVRKINSIRIKNICSCVIGAAGDRSADRAAFRQYASDAHSNPYFIKACADHEGNNLTPFIKTVSWLIKNGNYSLIRALVRIRALVK